MSGLTGYVKAAKVFAGNEIIDFPETVAYHDLKFAQRYVGFVKNIGEHVQLDEEVVQLAMIGAWVISASYGDEKISEGEKGDRNLPMSNLQEVAIGKLKEFGEEADMPADKLEALTKSFDSSFHPADPQDDIARLLVDASVSEILVEDGHRHTKRLYQEMILKGAPISKVRWYDAIIEVVDNFSFSFPYCQELLAPKKDKLLKNLLKDKKALDKFSDLAIKKELDISDRELKELKKNLEKSKDRDDRGIQTLFRTTSKNHYTLNEMIDKKANILITVNSIILSLVLGGVIGDGSFARHVGMGFSKLPIAILTLTAVCSIVFAILSIRPDVTHGSFTEEEIRRKGGNLLFYGNFHNMRERDYEWGFMQMMNDRNYMYSSMIKDIYHLGQTLNKKYRSLRISLTIFMFGLILSVVSFWATHGVLS